MVELKENIKISPPPPEFDQRLKDYRDRGLDRYRDSGLPGKKTEHWMKFDITSLKEGQFSEAEERNYFKGELPYRELEDFCERVDLINGYPYKSDDNLSYSLFDIATEKGRNEILAYLGKAGDERGKFFYNLNSALFRAPLLIRPKEDRERTPLFLSQHSDCEAKCLSSARVIIHVPDGETMDLIQSFTSEGAASSFSNNVTEIILGRGSRLNHLILLDDTGETALFNNLFVHQQESSIYESRSIITGGDLTRNEYVLDMDGEESQCYPASLFIGGENRIHNSDITINHLSPNCASKVVNRAIAGGESQGVFRGFTIVARDSQKTDAVQQFRTLLVGDHSQVNMEPHLEIWADDVKCSHGATVGQLDPQQLFYLQTRGFTPLEAKKILMEAFAADIAESISINGVDRIIREKIYRLMDGVHE